MAGEAAIEKVLTALRGALSGVAASVEVDRPEDDAHEKDEGDALDLRHVSTTFDQHSQNETLHRATIQIDMLVKVSAASSNAARLREMEAGVVETLWANRTLGGLAEGIELLSSGGDEDVRADDGARALSIEIMFRTPVGDHRTVIGTNGHIP